MKLRGKTFNKYDKLITNWMAKHAIAFIRISIGIIFFWFGFLKFFSGISPAEDLAIKTIQTISFNLIPDNIIIYSLAAVESIIGIGLIFKLFLREILLLLFLQMLGTLTPLILFPDECFTRIPYALTIEGQYIVKNLVIISGAIAIGASLRGKTFK